MPPPEGLPADLVHRVENRERCTGHTDVSKRTNREQIVSLAVAIAAGQAVTEWAQANEVPKRTAYRWSKLPAVRRIVADVRRRSIDRAIGTLSKHATRAAAEIARLAEKAESEAVKLAACRAVLSDLMSASEHLELSEAITAAERQVYREV